MFGVLATSKNSADIRWPRKSGWSMSIDSAGTVPVRAISSPSTSKVASISLNVVRKVETTMCFTAKDAVEWSLSRAQVPSRVEGAAALMWGSASSDWERRCLRATT